MKNEICEKYYIAQTKGEIKRLGLKVPHFCSLQKGHHGPHMCPGRGMHQFKDGGMHDTPLHFELQTPSRSPDQRVAVSRGVYR